MAEPLSRHSSYGTNGDSSPTTPPPWRILTLDGGGVRGLAELLILERIFRRMSEILKQEGQADQSDTLLPCDYFDIIGGTSTGGLIAVMLGRLWMSLPEVMANFKAIADGVFPIGKTPWFEKVIKVGAGKAVYDGVTLEGKVKSLLTARGGDPEMMLMETERPGCRVFVTTTRIHTVMPLVLRSYLPSDVGQAHHKVKIWQASRATSAAPPFFEPITIVDGVSSLTLLDGALRLNNPIYEAVREADSLDPDRGYGCILSLGTGLRDGPSLDKKSHFAKVALACARLATDCELVATQFLRDSKGARLSREGKYFRFNVPRRLEAVKLDAWEKHEAEQEYVETYLETMGTQLEACARLLLETWRLHQRHRHASLTNSLSGSLNSLSLQHSSPEVPLVNLTGPSSSGLTSTEPVSRGLDTHAEIEGLNLLMPNSTRLRHSRCAKPESPSRIVLTGNNDTATDSPFLIPPSIFRHLVTPRATSNHSIRSFDSGYSSSTSNIETQISSEIRAGHDLLARRLGDQAHAHFKRAKALLSSSPSPASSSSSSWLHTIHLGLSDCHVQAASAKGGAKGRHHLASAAEHAARALDAPRGDEASQLAAQLALIVVAVSKAELEAGTAGGGRAGRIDSVQAECLLADVDEFVGLVGAAAVGDGRGERLLKKAAAWRRRLLERHLDVGRPELPELGV